MATLTASVTDADNNLKSVTVNWGDGLTTNLTTSFATISVDHNYTQAGSYTVELIAEDDTSAKVQDSKTISITTPSNNVKPSIDSFIVIATDLQVNLSARVLDRNNNLSSVSIDWGDGKTNTVTSGFGAIALSHDYVREDSFTITLTATDSEAAKASTSKTVTTKQNTPTNSGPAGERIKVSVSSIEVIDDCDDIFTGDGDIYGDVTVNGFLMLDIYNDFERTVGSGDSIDIFKSKEFDYYYDEKGFVTIAGKLSDADTAGDDQIANWNIAVPFSSSMYGEKTVTSTPECSASISYNIERVSFLDKKPTPAQSDKSLKVLAYNVFMLPGILGTDNEERAKLIADQIKNNDVVILSEVFDNGIRDELLGTLKSSYPYRTEIVHVDDSATVQDGGVLILSKFPIERQAELLYNSCSSDCNAKKGAVYARIKKGTRYYNVFGTHTESGSASTRSTQFTQLKNFISSQAIPTSEALLIGGDLNVDKYQTTEYNAMLTTLNAQHPTQTGDFTYDNVNNKLIDSSEQSYLDYVLFSKSHLSPTSSSNIVRKFQSSSYSKSDLSDHYGLEGDFQFP